jgi:hypothetical protein
MSQRRVVALVGLIGMALLPTMAIAALADSVMCITGH